MPADRTPEPAEQPQRWEPPPAGRRWRRLGPGLALLAVGALLAVVGLPGDRDDNDLVIDAAPTPANGADSADEPIGPVEIEDPAPDLVPIPRPDGDIDLDTWGEATARDPIEGLPDGTGILYVVGRDQLARVDLTTGDRVVRDTPGLGGVQHTPVRLAVADDHVVVAGAHTRVVAVDRDLSGDPRLLASPEAAERDVVVDELLPGPEPGAVTLPIRGPDSLILHTVDITEDMVHRSEELPFHAQVLALAGPHILVGLMDTIIVYDLVTGDGEQVATGVPLAASAQHVAYLTCATDLTCQVVVQHIDEPDGVAVIAAPPRIGVWQHSLSPGGRWLRIPAGELSAPSWQLVDVTTGRTLEHPGDTPQPRPDLQTAAWTHDDVWMLHAHSSTISAFRPDDESHTELAPDVGQISAIAVAP